MKNGQADIDELLELARKGPTELGLEDVDRMVAGFPLGPAPFDWSSIINLNSIIMTSVSAFIIAGSMMLYSGTDTTANTPSLSPATDSVSTEQSMPLAERPDEPEACQMAEPLATVELTTEPTEPNSTAPTDESSALEELSTETLDIQPDIEQLEPIEPMEENRDLSLSQHLPAPCLEEPTPLASATSHMGDKARREFNLSDFEDISLAGAIHVDLRQGDSFEVYAEGSEAALERLRIDINGHSLDIGLKNIKSKHGHNCHTNCEALKVFITMPRFRALSVAGSGSLSVQSFDDLGGIEMSIAGSGDIHVDGDLSIAGRVKCSIAGSGSMHVNGTANSAEVIVAGSGDFDGVHLVANDAEVSISGSGDVAIHAAETLEVNIAGSGDVLYKGEPQLRQSILGSGDISRY